MFANIPATDIADELATLATYAGLVSVPIIAAYSLRAGWQTGWNALKRVLRIGTTTVSGR
jgi:hypothetical protein